MKRWLVTFDDSIYSAETPADAVEQAELPIGATVFAIDLEAIEGSAACVRMRLGAHEITEEK